MIDSGLVATTQEVCLGLW